MSNPAEENVRRDWTGPNSPPVRQVVHHLPDSHLNAYIRIRLALMEDQPTIKP